MTAKTLRTKRKDLGLSQFALSKISGVSRYNISLLENGHKKFTDTEMTMLNASLAKGITRVNRHKSK